MSSKSRQVPLKPVRVLYLKIHDLEYPRNQRLRSALSESVTPSFLVSQAGSRNFSFSAKDVWAIWRSARKSDVMILAEFQLKHALMAKTIAVLTRNLLVVDGFVGRVETVIGDWGQGSKRSVLALVATTIDFIAYRTSDIFLIDTDIRADDLRRRFKDSSDRIWTLPVGSPRSMEFTATRRPLEEERPLRVLYYGNYIPLHGVDFALDALIAASAQRTFDITFVGQGKERTHIQRKAARIDDRSAITFIDHLSVENLAVAIRDTDVVLGIFGGSRKAQTVIPNKVWQGLAAGKLVITRESQALDEIRLFAGSYLAEVSADDSRELTQQLLTANRIAMADGKVGRVLEEYVQLRYNEFLQYVDLAVRVPNRARKK